MISVLIRYEISSSCKGYGSVQLSLSRIKNSARGYWCVNHWYSGEVKVILNHDSIRITRVLFRLVFLYFCVFYCILEVQHTTWLMSAQSFEASSRYDSCITFVFCSTPFNRPYLLPPSSSYPFTHTHKKTIPCSTNTINSNTDSTELCVYHLHSCCLQIEVCCFTKGSTLFQKT